VKISIGNYPKDPKKTQKKSIRIDPWDTWNTAHTLADIIYPMLKQLKKTQMGAPFTDDEDVPEHLRSTAAKPKKNEWDTDEFHFKRWNWILGEMIWAFGELAKDRDPDFCLVTPKFKWVKKEGQEWSEMVTIREGKYDIEKQKAYQARKNNAFRLFGKYYENLWD
jgi:hypothetical protein